MVSVIKMAIKKEAVRLGFLTLLLAGVMVIGSLQLRPTEPIGSTLELRASEAGNSVPDGFFIWQNLDANGISLNSITQKNKTLVIKFNSDTQSKAAKIVLCKILPEGYIVASPDEAQSGST